MLSSRLAALVLVSLTTLSIAHAEDIGPERQELRAMKALYEEAVSKNELDRLLPMISSEFTFVTFTDSEFDARKSTFEQFKKEWNETRQKMLEGGRYSVSLDAEPGVIVGDLAYAHGIAHHKIVKGDGTTYELPGQWTAIVRRTEGKWKVVRAHSSISAFDNPILSDVVKSLVLKATILAAAVGLFIGAIGMLIFSRFRNRN